MILDYFLTENDYIQFHLYEVSQENAKKRYKFTAIYSSFFLFFAILLYIGGKGFYSILFIFLFLLVVFVVPSRLKDLYFNSNVKYVKENYKDLCKIKYNLAIDSEFIQVTTENSIVKFVSRSCKRIIETKSGFYLIFGLNFIIIPKREDVECIKKELLKISTDNGIQFIEDVNWKW